jgi:Ferredoxin-dependent bilin reductase.
MHINVFPEANIDVPIFGLDIVASSNKISGCFCDYSPTNESTSQQEYLALFKDITSNLNGKEKENCRLGQLKYFQKI